MISPILSFGNRSVLGICLLGSFGVFHANRCYLCIISTLTYVYVLPFIRFHFPSRTGLIRYMADQALTMLIQFLVLLAGISRIAARQYYEKL